MLGVFLARSFATEPAADPAMGTPRYTYVIVHGASGGGWDWKTVDRLLSADGHTVFRPSLSGLGEKVHLASPDINLTTHINDIVNVILYENLHDVVLVGHSYGGMVITGVMDRIPDRIRHVIFLDAAVPDNGQCALDLWGPLPPEEKVVNGLVYFPWLDASKAPPRDEPQSLKCFTEPVSYKNPVAKLLAATYAAFIPAEQSAALRAEMDMNWHRAKARGWTICTLASDHNAQRNHPKELVTLLEDAPKDRNNP
jgi:pimeloyl-ACP methyl ester carboxylesterase